MPSATPRDVLEWVVSAPCEFAGRQIAHAFLSVLDAPARGSIINMAGRVREAVAHADDRPASPMVLSFLGVPRQVLHLAGLAQVRTDGWTPYYQMHRDGPPVLITIDPADIFDEAV